MSDVERAVRTQKDDAILTLLAKLAINYWRPDFTAGQARELYSQYLEDLRDWPFGEIVAAMQKHRQSGEKFFPTSGQLLESIKAVPSWDVISPQKHREQLRARARDEVQEAVLQLQAGKTAGYLTAE